jgi:hypothetical protein
VAFRTSGGMTPIVSTLLNQLRSSKCTMPSFTCKPGGSTSTGDANDIEFGLPASLDRLRHELVHAVQNCLRGPMSLVSCDERLAREIEAYFRSSPDMYLGHDQDLCESACASAQHDDTKCYTTLIPRRDAIGTYEPWVVHEQVADLSKCRARCLQLLTARRLTPGSIVWPSGCSKQNVPPELRPDAP